MWGGREAREGGEVCVRIAGNNYPPTEKKKKKISSKIKVEAIPLQVYEIVKVLVTQLCPTLCDPMDCSPSGSSVHEILQARILEWVAIPFSRKSS